MYALLLGGMGCLNNSGKMSDTLKEDLIGSWKMDKVPTAQRCEIQDSSEYGSHGECFGDTYFAKDRYGNADKALQFNGGTADHVSIPHHPIFNTMGNSMTIATWVYNEGNKVVENQDRGSYMISKGRDNEPDSWFLATRAFYAQQPDKPDVPREKKSGNGIMNLQNIPTNKWIFVVAVLNDRSGKIYVDGKVWLDGQARFEGNFKPDSNFAPLILGQHHNKASGRDARWTFPFKGIMDDVRIWKRPLSNMEVRALYEAEKPTAWQEMIQNATLQWSIGLLFYLVSLWGAWNRGRATGQTEVLNEVALREAKNILKNPQTTDPIFAENGQTLSTAFTENRHTPETNLNAAQKTENLPGLFEPPTHLSIEDQNWHRKIVETIRANQHAVPFGTQELASALHTTSRTLQRDTKALFGCSPKQLIEKVLTK